MYLRPVPETPETAETPETPETSELYDMCTWCTCFTMTPRDILVSKTQLGSGQVHSTPFDGSAESGPTQVTSEIAEDKVINPSLKIASRSVLLRTVLFFSPGTSERYPMETNIT